MTPGTAAALRWLLMPEGPRPDDSSPLDDVFVEGARFREPSAAERARAAREAEHRAKREQRQRNKRVAHTRRVLGGGGRHGVSGGAVYDKRVALIALGVMLGVSVLLSQTAFAH